jgi:Tol biopolymer transport system component/predicted Ser/Thr protein kinase
MLLPSGTRLGHYEVLELIGAGGMGEVYRAHDPRLGRDVAIKVSASEFNERFDREARSVAALNHPNICTLHDVGPNYLVMEFVEGETLKGPLSLDETLRVARQIANALDAAHERGIVHRDLKPGNIKIKSDGTVKVLDFGLAKNTSPRPGSVSGSDASNSPTISLAATQAGVILGTAAYMAPEQARGKAIDKRVDIWAFGVVLYELLTGERLFQGEDVTETLASVVKEQPDLTRVPREVRRLLDKCLQKDPKKRLRDIADVWELLDTEPPAAPSTPIPQARRGFLAWFVAAALAIAFGALAFLHFRETSPPEHRLRYTIPAPSNVAVPIFAVSPDGRYLAITGSGRADSRLWLQALDSFEAQPLALTEGALYPFWSPDSRYIGFFAQGRLKKIPIGGGPPQTIFDGNTSGNLMGATWSRDDIILFAPGVATNVIRRVPATGGQPSDLLQTKPFALFPVFLPDGRHFLYTGRSPATGESGIYFASLDGKENRRILADLSTATFAPSTPGSHIGHILFTRQNNLLAQSFDSSRGEVSGEAIPVAEGVSHPSLPFFSTASVSDTGLLLYWSRGSGTSGTNQIVWYDRSGKVLEMVTPPSDVWEPSIAPNEKTIAFARFSGTNSDIWFRDLDHGVERRFTAEAARNDTPIWSPEGDRIVFRSNRTGPQQIYIRSTNGSGMDELLPTDNNPKFASQWPTNNLVVYSERDQKTNIDLWLLPLDGDRKPMPFLRSQFDEAQGQVSPDQHWIAYMSDVSGQREVYIRQFRSGDGELRISTAGGEQPRWRRDGKELFYIAADGKMTSVAVKAVATPTPVWDHGPPVQLFDTRIAINADTRATQYDVTADGKRFLVAINSDTSGPNTPPITVLVNWQKTRK